MSQNKRYLTKPAVARRYGKTSRTIDRWISDPNSRFPRPVLINGRKHWEEAIIEEYERTLAADFARPAMEAA